jgi:hypothetical protein
MNSTIGFAQHLLLESAGNAKKHFFAETLKDGNVLR